MRKCSNCDKPSVDDSSIRPTCEDHLEFSRILCPNDGFNSDKPYLEHTSIVKGEFRYYQWICPKCKFTYTLTLKTGNG